MNPSLRLHLVLTAAVILILPTRAALNCSITGQGNQVVISWPSESGKTYALHRSDKPDGNWRVVSLKTAAAEPLLVTVPVEGTTAFFRLIEAPPNPDVTKLVWIPPGTFTMGSPTDELDRSGNEGPQTTVTISAGFWMGKREVTQGEYEAVMGNNPSWFNGVRQDWPALGMSTDFGSDPDRPVEDLRTYPTDYCADLTNRERANGQIGADLVGFRVVLAPGQP